MTHVGCGAYLYEELLSVYSTAPADWTSLNWKHDKVVANYFINDFVSNVKLNIANR